MENIYGKQICKFQKRTSHENSRAYIVIKFINGSVHAFIYGVLMD
jgi:hypothetical protein